MIRPLINLTLGMGYVMGVFFVWIGIEMYAIDGARLAPSLVSVIAGIMLWQIMVGAGRVVRRRQTFGGVTGA